VKRPDAANAKICCLACHVTLWAGLTDEKQNQNKTLAVPAYLLELLPKGGLSDMKAMHSPNFLRCSSTLITTEFHTSMMVLAGLEYVVCSLKPLALALQFATAGPESRIKSV